MKFTLKHNNVSLGSQLAQAWEDFFACSVMLCGAAFLAWLFITICPASEWPF